MILGLVVVAVIVYIQEGQRRIPIQYASRVRGRRMYQGGATFLPLRVNQAGVIPIIFAVSILLFPTQIASYFATPANGAEAATIVNRSPTIVNFLSPQGIPYIIFYFLLTMGFTYFYTAFTFKPDETADQLRKNGGFIPGIRPGAPTRDYLHEVVFGISLAGAIFLGIVAVSPLILSRALPGGVVGRLQPRRHGVADRRVGGGRDDEAARGAADDAQLRGLHQVTEGATSEWLAPAPGGPRARARHRYSSWSAARGRQGHPGARWPSGWAAPRLVGRSVPRRTCARTALGKKVQSYLDTGALVPDDVTVQMVATG